MLDEVIKAAPWSTARVLPAVVADVGIRDGRVVAIGSIDEPAAVTTIDASRLHRGPRLHRPAHPLRRPAHVGPAGLAVEPEHGVTTVIERQLRVHAGAAAARRR
jgi:N-acyl-D-aspartate/D-glutamate deacylase